MDGLLPIVIALVGIFLFILYHERSDHKLGYIKQICPRCNKQEERPRTEADARDLRRETILCARCSSREIKSRRF